jgi:3-dehydroquinate synthase
MPDQPTAGGGARVRVSVPTRPARTYDVIIGAGSLTRLADAAALAAPAAAYAVLAPHDVAHHYGAAVLRTFHDAGLRAELLAFDAGEAHKTRSTWAGLTDRMLELRFGRDCAVVGLGGGVTGDMAGFVAATYMRGVPVVQVPTTLLAMLDASVGGKTGVDTPAGKNLVGAFHPPALVVIDPLVLRTLPQHELRAGMAEAIKHGAILDAVYLEWLYGHAAPLLALDEPATEYLIRRSVELKADVVAQDLHEHGRRAILNFGHTIGHAVELHSDYAISHGFAVAAGMAAEARIGEAVGLTASGTHRQLAAVLAAFGLPIDIEPDPTVLMDAMRVDKKARAAEPRFVLLERIGRVAAAPDGGWTHAVDAALLLRALSAGDDV